MTKKEEEWTVQNIVVICVMCYLLYGAGIVLLYLKSTLGFGFVIVSTLFFVPTLIEARKNIRRYLKKRRTEKLRRSREPIIVGGTPQGHHKKKKRQPDVFEYYVPIVDDET